MGASTVYAPGIEAMNREASSSSSLVLVFDLLAQGPEHLAEERFVEIRNGSTADMALES